MLAWLKSFLGVPLDDFLAVRNPGWSRVRSAHLLTQPDCQFCGTLEACEVHHIWPVHFPGGDKLELSLGNLLTLCRPCHWNMGHLGDWKARNPLIVFDCQRQQQRRRQREYPCSP